MSEEPKDLSGLLSELQDIKKLLILTLVREGILQNDVAAALNLDPSTVSKMFPKGLWKKVRPSSSK